MAKKPKVGIQQLRTVELAVREVNEEERRIRVSFSSEQAVSRWYGQEILSHDTSCIDLTRLNSIGVALWNHKRDVVIGRIENAVVDEVEKRTYADIIFDTDEESEKIYQKVRSGTLKGISVGYSVDAWEEVKAGKVSSNGRFMGPCDVAVKWQPYEISVVSVPADDSVGIGRNLENEEGEEREMGENNNPTPVAPQQAAPQPTVNVENERHLAIQQERQRVADITGLCREFGVNSDEFINGGHSIEDVRAQVLEQLRAQRTPSATSSQDVTVTADEADKFRRAAADSILLRAGRNIETVAEGARELRGMGYRDLAIECLQLAGVSQAQRLHSDELFKRALSPDSQFSSILSDAVNKSMATAYKGQVTTYQQWTGTGSMTDFKDAPAYQISEAGELSKMTQTGEFKFDEMTDTKVTKSIATFGKTFGITRQALINDDISILTRIPEAYVRAAGRGINKLVYSMLQSNPKIYDGKALFDAAHGNLASTGGALSIQTLGAGRAAMRKQKNLRGKETLNIAPKYLIVSPDLEVAALQLLGSTADPNGAHSGVVNIFRNSFEIVVDAELTENSWYLAAAPSDIDTIEVSYLNGDAMPKLESQVGFDYLGMKWRIYHDYGVNVLDFRGLYKNPGASN